MDNNNHHHLMIGISSFVYDALASVFSFDYDSLASVFLIDHDVFDDDVVLCSFYSAFDHGKAKLAPFSFPFASFFMPQQPLIVLSGFPSFLHLLHQAYHQSHLNDQFLCYLYQIYRIYLHFELINLFSLLQSFTVF